jgi:hypothetical protein
MAAAAVAAVGAKGAVRYPLPWHATPLGSHTPAAVGTTPHTQAHTSARSTYGYVGSRPVALLVNVGQDQLRGPLRMHLKSCGKLSVVQDAPKPRPDPRSLQSSPRGPNDPLEKGLGDPHCRVSSGGRWIRQCTATLPTALTDISGAGTCRSRPWPPLHRRTA